MILLSRISRMKRNRQIHVLITLVYYRIKFAKKKAEIISWSVSLPCGGMLFFFVYLSEFFLSSYIRLIIPCCSLLQAKVSIITLPMSLKQRKIQHQVCNATSLLFLYYVYSDMSTLIILGYIHDIFPVVLVSLVIITSLYGIVAAMVFIWAKYGWHHAHAAVGDVERQKLHPEIACYGALERSTTYYDWNRTPPYRHKPASNPTRYPPQVRRFYHSSVLPKNHPRHLMSHPSSLLTMEERQNHWHKRRDALLKKFAAPTTTSN